MPSTRASPDGLYPLGGLDSGRNALVRDGVAWIEDGSAFAGSVATADMLLRTAVKDAGIQLREAVEMWSTTPARVAGVGDRKGSLAPGKDADIVTMSPELEVHLVLARGRAATAAYGLAEGEGGAE